MYVPTANTDFANSGHVTLLHVSSVNPGIIDTDTERWDTPRKSIMRIASTRACMLLICCNPSSCLLQMFITIINCAVLVSWACSQPWRRAASSVTQLGHIWWCVKTNTEVMIVLCSSIRRSLAEIADFKLPDGGSSWRILLMIMKVWSWRHVWNLLMPNYDTQLQTAVN